MNSGKNIERGRAPAAAVPPRRSSKANKQTAIVIDATPVVPSDADLFGSPEQSRKSVWALSALAVVMLLAYWSTLSHLAGRWMNEPEYSHGFFVPIFAGALLWFRRDMVAGKPWVGHWSGLLFIALGAAMRLASTYWFYTLAGAYALLPALVGVALVIGGRRALQWAWPSIAFLVFMIPLPGFISSAMAHPLQRLATICSTYLLQLLGVPATGAGNVIHLSHSKIGVVEACSGLRMLILFFAVSTAVAMVVKRPLWERLLLIASAVPIALLVNIARITITGELYEWVNSDVAEKFFHDVAGLFMGPMAVLVLWLEMKFLDHSLIAVNRKPIGI